MDSRKHWQSSCCFRFLPHLFASKLRNFRILIRVIRNKWVVTHLFVFNGRNCMSVIQFSPNYCIRNAASVGLRSSIMHSWAGHSGAIPLFHSLVSGGENQVGSPHLYQGLYWCTENRFYIFSKPKYNCHMLSFQDFIWTNVHAAVRFVKFAGRWNNKK